jgi:hypothetical protein
MTTQNPSIYDLGAKPIDFAAACLLFKAPWWAKAPENVKFALSHHKIEINAFLNLTKPPPPEVKNRIGQRCHSSTVIGYAYRNDSLSPSASLRVRKNHRPELRSHRSQIWFVLFDNGSVQHVSNKTLNRWLKMDSISWSSVHYPKNSTTSPFILGHSLFNLTKDYE